MLNCVLSVGRIRLTIVILFVHCYINFRVTSIVCLSLFFFQSYVVCELPEKLNFLYSFIRNHIKSKILVFVSSCKQVRV